MRNIGTTAVISCKARKDRPRAGRGTRVRADNSARRGAYFCNLGDRPCDDVVDGSLGVLSSTREGSTGGSDDPLNGGFVVYALYRGSRRRCRPRGLARRRIMVMRWL